MSRRVVVALVVVALAAWPPAGAADGGSFADPQGDVGACEGDIVSFFGEHKEQNRDQVELTLSTGCPSDFAQWYDTTALVWKLETTGDEESEFSVEYTAATGGPRASVLDRAGNETCRAAPAWDLEQGVYRAWFGRMCIGYPDSFRLRADTVRDSAPYDVAPNDGFSAPIAFAADVPPPPPPPPPFSPPRRSGYWMLGAKGAVYPFGDARHFGDAPVGAGNAVDIEATPSFDGYWIVDDGGHVYAFGDAPYAGGARGLSVGEKVTAISGTQSGRGYWLFTNRGRVFGYGDAVHHMYGDMGGVSLNGPVLDSMPTSTGNGYYMVASDGGIFAFGDGRFFGSMGGHRLNKPVESLVADGDRTGYWLVASDGGVFAFDAPFRGSIGNLRLNKPVTGMVRFGDGYLMVAEDGGIFNFSNKPFQGSLGNNPPPIPIVNVTALDE